MLRLFHTVQRSLILQNLTFQYKDTYFCLFSDPIERRLSRIYQMICKRLLDCIENLISSVCFNIFYKFLFFFLRYYFFSLYLCILLTYFRVNDVFRIRLFSFQH